jgi:glycosyltransferase involved in cell wall biosynthesis
MEKIDVVMVGEFPRDPAFIKGGIQASVYGLARTLKEFDSVGEVRVFALPVDRAEPQAPKNIDGIAVRYFGVPWKFMSSSAIYAPDVLRGVPRTGASVLHVHGTGLLQAVLCVGARLRKTPLIWTIHGITAKETADKLRKTKTPAALMRHILYRLLETLQLWVSPTVIVDTPYVLDEIYAMAENIHVIPQGIFTEELAPCREAKREKPVILSLGVMEARKGHHLTLEAFAKTLKPVPKARLIIAGAETDTAYTATLRARATELGVADKVEILTDLPRARVLELLCEAKIFALHSQEESQGIVFCEAMAAGLPIVATHVGGIPFVVSDDKTGILTPYGDVDAFAAAFTRLLTNDEEYDTMAAAAIEAGRHFDWETVAGQVLDLYRKAV